MLTEITQELTRLGSGVKIVADEWCNTYQDIVAFTDAGSCHMVQIKTPDLGGINNVVEAVLYCKEKGIAPTRAAPATRPTAAPRSASTWPWHLPRPDPRQARHGGDEGT